MIALFLVVALLVTVLEWASIRRGFDCLEVELAFSKQLVEPGESFQLEVTLTNSRRSFFPFIRVEIPLPEGCSPDIPESRIYRDSRGRVYVDFTTWVAPRQRMRREFPISFCERGRYLIQKLSLQGGDFLGLNTTGSEKLLLAELVVMPREARQAAVDEALGGTLGDISVRRFLYEDPVLTVGYRDYTGREPFKMISWTQAARTGKLMVKQYDYTAEASACVILHIPEQPEEKEVLEECYCLARTICRELEEKRISYAFCTNSLTIGDFDSFRMVSKGLGERHFLHIMEGLGRAEPQARQSCEELLRQAAMGSEETKSFLFITPREDAEVLRRAQFWAASAGGSLTVFTGEEALCSL